MLLDEKKFAAVANFCVVLSGQAVQATRRELARLVAGFSYYVFNFW
jgi:hypothetical protein